VPVVAGGAKLRHVSECRLRECSFGDVLSPFEKEQSWRPVLNDICETINVYQPDPALFHKALDGITNRQMTKNLTLEDKMISCMEIVNTLNLVKEGQSPRVRRSCIVDVQQNGRALLRERRLKHVEANERGR
jgi:hypothetical protein